MQPWYPGQLGVNGSDVQRGLRWSPTAIVLYVDDNHPGASAAADGTDPEHPLTTVQLAVNRLISFQTSMSASLVGSVIVVGAGATLTESVIVPATAPRGCTILGESNGGYNPSWLPGASAGTNLTLRQQDWHVSGITFNFTGNSTAIELQWNGTNTINASGAVIDNCRFFGGWSGLRGIYATGSPYNVRILNNEFSEIRSAGGAGTAYAVYGGVTPIAEPLEWQIVGNVFSENENHVGSLNGLYSLNGSLVQGNLFGYGTTIAAAINLDLRSGHGGRNIVVGNLFAGDYSNTGGYYDSTAAVSSWVGNYAEDVLEAEVGDNGITIAPPAA
jgi:hypothetical protein